MVVDGKPGVVEPGYIHEVTAFGAAQSILGIITHRILQGGVGIRMPDQGLVGRSGRQA
jgi:hypothetical protein